MIGKLQSNIVEPLNKINLKHTKKCQQYIDNVIYEHIKKTIQHPLLREMCHYSTSDGKRVRSVIIDSMNKKRPQYSINAILFIEYLHASSLIMDDIMDKDSFRRGQLCSYKKYGYCLSQLTAIQLMAMSLVQIAEMMKNIHSSMITPVDKDRLMVWIFDNITSNFHNLCLGQFMDIKADRCDVQSLINRKTTTLFEISFILGWLLSGRDLININQVKLLANDFGLIFQIADDFEDYYKDYKQNPQNNYVIVNGPQKSYENFIYHKKKFLSLAKQLNILTPEINEITDYLDEKVKISLSRF